MIAIFLSCGWCQGCTALLTTVIRPPLGEIQNVGISLLAIPWKICSWGDCILNSQDFSLSGPDHFLCCQKLWVSNCPSTRTWLMEHRFVWHIARFAPTPNFWSVWKHTIFIWWKVHVWGRRNICSRSWVRYRHFTANTLPNHLQCYLFICLINISTVSQVTRTRLHCIKGLVLYLVYVAKWFDGTLLMM